MIIIFRSRPALEKTGVHASLKPDKNKAPHWGISFLMCQTLSWDHTIANAQIICLPRDK